MIDFDEIYWCNTQRMRQESSDVGTNIYGGSGPEKIFGSNKLIYDPGPRKSGKYEKISYNLYTNYPYMFNKSITEKNKKENP